MKEAPRDNTARTRAKEARARPQTGPLGDVMPGREEADPRTSGGQAPEPVEDRGTTGQVSPEDYPAADRARSSDL